MNIMETMEFTGFGDHSIVCGYTPLCSEFLKSLKSMNVPIVIIVRDLELAIAQKNEGYIVGTARQQRYYEKQFKKGEKCLYLFSR